MEQGDDRVQGVKKISAIVGVQPVSLLRRSLEKEELPGRWKKRPKSGTASLEDGKNKKLHHSVSEGIGDHVDYEA